MRRRGVSRGAAVRALLLSSLAAAVAGGCGGEEGAGAPAAEPAAERPAGLTEAEWGERLFGSYGCTACHTITGTGSVGGPLDELIGKTRPLADGTETVADPEYLRRAIVDPQADVVEGYTAAMPSYEEQLTDAEVRALVAYLRSLR